MKIMLFMIIIELAIIALCIVENKRLRKRQHSTQLSYWRQAHKVNSLETENCRLRLEKQDTDKQLAGVKAVLLGITFQMRKRNNADVKRLEE